MDTLFGSSPQIKTVPTRFTNRLDPFQQTGESTLATALGGAPGTGFAPYGGELSAPLTGLQSQSLEALTAALMPTGGTRETQNQANSTVQSLMTQGPQDFTDYYRTNVEQPLTQTFQERTLPTILSALGGSLGGPQSTAAVQGVTKAGRDFENTLAATSSKLAFDTGQATANRQLAAASAAPAIARSPIDTLIQTLTAGGTEQATRQAADTAKYTDYLKQQGFKQQDIANLLALLGLNTQVADQNVVDPGSPGLVGTFLGSQGGSSAAGSILTKLLGM